MNFADFLSALPTMDSTNGSGRNGSAGVNATSAPETLDDYVQTVLSVVLSSMLVVLMCSMGCTMELMHIKNNLRRPFGVIIGFTSQFGLLPLMAFGLGHALQMRPNHALGLLMISCSPGGAMSNVYTYWLDGDIPLSICMTACSTLLAMGMMPLCLLIYSRSWTSANFNIPYGDIALSLVIILIPALGGMLIRWKSVKVAEKVAKVGSIMGIIVIVGSIVFAVATSYNLIFSIPWNVWISAFLLPFLGFGFGFLMAYVLRQPLPSCRAIGMETGCQNTPLCLTIIAATFSSEIAGDVSTVPLLFGFFNTLDAGIWLAGYLLKKRFFPNKNEFLLEQPDALQVENISSEEKASPDTGSYRLNSSTVQRNVGNGALTSNGHMNGGLSKETGKISNDCTKTPPNYVHYLDTPMMINT